MTVPISNREWRRKFEDREHRSLDHRSLDISIGALQFSRNLQLPVSRRHNPSMDYLWTPWRFAYLTGAEKTTGCIFCNMAARQDDRANLIVHRGQHCFVVLNRYPYTSGHAMVVPYAHLDQFQILPAEAATEMFSLCQRLERVLRKLYRPDGVNMGMNIGKAAGAGVADHIHMHMLPRWVADANFVSVIGETRVLPEDLEVTYQRMKEQF